MIDHISLAVSDLARAKAFYADALAPLGYRVSAEFEGVFALGGPTPDGSDPGGEIWVSESSEVQPVHIAFLASDAAQVRAFHEAGLAAGGADNGGPGERPHYHPGYYGAFVHDPDGHNVEAVFHAWTPEQG